MQNLTADLAADPAPEMAADFIQQQGSKLVRWLILIALFTAVYHAHSQLYVARNRWHDRIDNTARQIVDFDVADAHTAVLAVSYQDQPSVLTRDLTQQTERVLYNPNAAYEETLRLLTPNDLTSSRLMGRRWGWYLPAQTGPEATGPVVRSWGPHGNYGETFFHEFLAHASRGFGVVFSIHAGQ